MAASASSSLMVTVPAILLGGLREERRVAVDHPFGRASVPDISDERDPVFSRRTCGDLDGVLMAAVDHDHRGALSGNRFATHGQRASGQEHAAGQSAEGGGVCDRPAVVSSAGSDHGVNGRLVAQRAFDGRTTRPGS
jgi:hypothetical protein